MRGLGGITDARLFSHCYVGTKRLVEEYVDEMCAALQALVDAPAHEFSPVCCIAWELVGSGVLKARYGTRVGVKGALLHGFAGSLRAVGPGMCGAALWDHIFSSTPDCFLMLVV